MAGKSEWNHVNVLVLDIMWSMYKGVRASDLIKDQAKVGGGGEGRVRSHSSQVQINCSTSSLASR